MANEITATATLTVTKSGQTSTGTISKSITLTGSKQWMNTQVIGTSAEQLSFPSDLTTEGLTYLWLYNADSTNYVEIALDSGMTQIFCKLLAGQPALIRAYTANPTYYARANTAAIDLRMVAVGT
jgi:hypothetical protein